MLAQPSEAQSRHSCRDDCFHGKHNAVIGLYRQILCREALAKQEILVSLPGKATSLYLRALNG